MWLPTSTRPSRLPAERVMRPEGRALDDIGVEKFRFEWATRAPRLSRVSRRQVGRGDKMSI